MEIKIYIGYNERRNQLTKATAEVVDRLPEIGDEINQGQYIIDNIVKEEPDVATWFIPNACEYDYYWVHAKDNSSDPDFADDYDEFYLAVKKEEKE